MKYRDKKAKKYGVLDTVDNVWMGNTQGPVTYDDRKLAQVAAAVIAERLGWPLNRCQAVTYSRPSPKLRDTVKAKMTTLEAIRRLEAGAEE